MMRSSTVAIHIARTSWVLASRHLCSFALWTDRLSAMVGRDTHDSYEHSVTLGVAARRPSRGT